MSETILDRIRNAAVISIVRGIPYKCMLQTAQALYEGGITAVEVTFNSPDALESLRLLKSSFGDKMLVGAGTVLDPETAKTAISEGAEFILAPSLNIKVIEMCLKYGKLAVPGVLTPTEIVTACEAGAQVVKIFPARAFGPAYIRDIRAPLNNVNIVAVGGVTIDNTADLISAGAIGVGVGSELVNLKLVSDGAFDEIKQRASIFVQKAKNAAIKG